MAWPPGTADGPSQVLLQDRDPTSVALPSQALDGQPSPGLPGCLAAAPRRHPCTRRASSPPPAARRPGAGRPRSRAAVLRLHVAGPWRCRCWSCLLRRGGGSRLRRYARARGRGRQWSARGRQVRPQKTSSDLPPCLLWSAWSASCDRERPYGGGGRSSRRSLSCGISVDKLRRTTFAPCDVRNRQATTAAVEKCPRASEQGGWL